MPFPLRCCWWKQNKNESACDFFGLVDFTGIRTLPQKKGKEEATHRAIGARQKCGLLPVFPSNPAETLGGEISLQAQNCFWAFWRIQPVSHKVKVQRSKQQLKKRLPMPRGSSDRIDVWRSYILRGIAPWAFSQKPCYLSALTSPRAKVTGQCVVHDAAG